MYIVDPHFALPDVEMLVCLDCGASTEGCTVCPSCREYRKYIEQGGGVIVTLKEKSDVVSD